MKKFFRNVFTVSFIAIAGILSSQSNARSLTVSLNSVSGDNYNFDVTLDSGESIAPGDTLVFNNLEDITNASATSPFQLSSIGNGFSNTNAIFDVTSMASGVTTLSNTIQLTSTASLDTDSIINNVEYNLFTETVAFSGTPILDVSASVPFEFSPGLGIALMTGFLGFNYLKKRSTSKLS